MKLTKKTALLLILLVAVFGVMGYKYVQEEPSIGSKSVDNLKREERLSLKKNIVVMGVDERSDDVGRSDTLFTVMYDSKNNNASLLSIPRDTMVKIPKNGWDKANHAYAYGGYKMTRQMVEELLGIQINNYILIDFKGFVRIIDAIGGVDINVEKDMYYEDPYDGNDGLVIDLEKGMQHLDGEHAIQYVRYRDEDGDIGRIKRQQHFIAAVYDKVLSAKIITSMPGLIKEITSMIKTDMSLTDMAALAKSMYADVKKGGLQMATVPGESVYIEGISYWVPDMTDLRKQMVEMQGGTMTEKYRLAAEKYEAEYDRLLPKSQMIETKDAKTDKKVKVIKKPETKEIAEAVKTAKKTEKVVEKAVKISPKPEKAVTAPAEEKKPVKDAQPEKKETAAEKPAEGSKPAEAPKAAEAPKQVTVQIINCSGKPEALDKVIAAAQNVGLVVVGSGTGDKLVVTQVVANSGSDNVVNQLAVLPFRYALRIVSDAAAGVDGTIYIGEDFK